MIFKVSVSSPVLHKFIPLTASCHVTIMKKLSQRPNANLVCGSPALSRGSGPRCDRTVAARLFRSPSTGARLHRHSCRSHRSLQEKDDLIVLQGGTDGRIQDSALWAPSTRLLRQFPRRTSRPTTEWMAATCSWQMTTSFCRLHIGASGGAGKVRSRHADSRAGCGKRRL